MEVFSKDKIEWKENLSAGNEGACCVEALRKIAEILTTM
jgi:hypothetical protein